MAPKDGSGTPAKTPVELATAGAESIAKFLAAAAGSKELKPEEAASALPKLTEAEDIEAYTRRKYDLTTKWLLGFFGLAALLIFGSVPFVGTDDITGRGWVGLAAAAIGIALVAVGGTRAYEPQNASLGELAATLEEIANAKPKPWTRATRPVKAANMRLRVMLSNDPGAHLGPGITDVPALIAKLTQLDADILKIHSPGTLAASTETENLTTGSEAVEEGLARADQLAPPLNPSTPTLSEDQLKILQKARALQYARTLYLERRELVLHESAVAQITGAFRLARNFIVVGAICVAVGGVFYASQIGDVSTSDDERQQGRLTLPARFVAENSAVPDPCRVELQETPNPTSYTIDATLVGDDTFELGGLCIGEKLTAPDFSGVTFTPVN
jgi:hypothetical protein